MKTSQLLLLLLITMLSGCQTNGRNSAPGSQQRDPWQGRISPLGLSQPDPELIIEEALADFENRRIWAFLSHFGFFNPENGEFFIPRDGDGGEFAAASLQEIRPLAQSLFFLRAWDFATVTYGTPVTVRNSPLVVEVPVTIDYHFNKLDAPQRAELMRDVNTSMRNQGLPTVTFESYAVQVEALPREGTKRFIYLEKSWRIDGGPWRPSGI